MSYTPIYKKPYEQWKELPSKETLVTAEVLTQYDDTFENIEEYLESEGKKEYALVTEAGYSIVASIDEYYVLTVVLKNKAGNVLSTSEPIDLPIESMIINVDYDEESGILTFSLQNGQTLDVNISTLVRGLVPTSRKIAGVDLEDDITADELKTALGVFDNTVTAGELKPWLNSLEEIQAGVWLNGKPLYQKTIVAEITTSGETYVNHNIENVDFIMVAKASFLSVYNGATLNWTLGSYDNRNTIMFARKNDISVQISETGVLIPCTVYATLQYTKTTDAEGSGKSLNPYGIYDAKLDDVKSSIASVSDEVDAVEEKVGKLKYEWTANIKCATWQRLCYLSKSNSYGANYLIHVEITRSDVLISDTFFVEATAKNFATIVKVSGNNYKYNSPYSVRVVLDATGSGYFEIYDSTKGATSDTSINVYCTLIPLSFESVVTFNKSTDGTTVPSNYSVSATMEVKPSSFQSDVTDAINSRLAYKDISSSIDVGDSGCTASGYVENGQVIIQIVVPAVSHPSTLTIDSAYAPRLMIVGSFAPGQSVDRGSVDIMWINSSGTIYIGYAKELTAKGYVTFTYPLKSS